MTDLLDGGSVLVVDVDPNPPEPKVRTNSEGLELGVCRVCGDEATGPNATYCAEHRTRQPRATEGGTDSQPSQPTGTAKVLRPSRSGKGAPTADEWNNKLFQKVVGAFTDVVASQLVRRYNLNDPTGEIADSLAMTNEEAGRVAKPIGRFMAGTALNKRIGRKVLDNSDLVDAAFAMYDWYDRVNKTLRGKTPAQLASVTPIQRPAQGGEYVENEPEATGSGIPDGGFPNLHGANYVP
jgi:hypothetical protein